IPAEVLKKHRYDEGNREAFYRAWLQDLADEVGANGIVVMIYKDQKHNDATHIEVGVGRETQKKAFTLSNRNELYRILRDGWGKDRDRALLDGVQYVDDTLESHHKASNPAVVPPVGQTTPHNPGRDQDRGGFNIWGSIFGLICIGLCVIAGIWL